MEERSALINCTQQNEFDFKKEDQGCHVREKTPQHFMQFRSKLNSRGRTTKTPTRLVQLNRIVFQPR